MRKKISLRNKLLAVLAVMILVLGGLLYIVHRRNALMEGDSESSIVIDGMERTYLVHPPAHLEENDSVPLLIALHGGGGSGKDMERLTEGKFNRLADEKGFVVVYPDAVDKHWNDGRGIPEYRSNAEDIDDVGFISALIERMHDDYGVNTSRVYVTGMSNGALMSFRLACEIPDEIKAVAAVAGYLTVNLSSELPEFSNVSLLIIGGVEDPIMPWNGGTIHLGERKFGEVISAVESTKIWSDVCGCRDVENRTYLPDRDPDDGTRIWVERSENDLTGAEVRLYGIEGGGHTWPSGYHYLPESIVGRTSMDMDACTAIWDFFERH